MSRHKFSKDSVASEGEVYTIFTDEVDADVETWRINERCKKWMCKIFIQMAIEFKNCLFDLMSDD